MPVHCSQACEDEYNVHAWQMHEDLETLSQGNVNVCQSVMSAQQTYD